MKLIENEPLLRYDVSLPPRGAWIEIAIPCVEIISVKSLPPRGAWIEIAEIEEYNKSDAGRSPHGERGLKYLWPRFLVQAYPGRSPHGERGLKYVDCAGHVAAGDVAPPTGSVD